MGFVSKRLFFNNSTWLTSRTELPRPSPLTQFWRIIVAGGGKFVSALYRGPNAIYSENLASFNITTIPTEYTYVYWSSIAYGKGIFSAVGGTEGGYSYDGITWVASSSTIGGNSIAYGKGIFVSVGNSSSYSYSTNGINYTTGSIPPVVIDDGISTRTINPNYTSVAYGNGMFVAVNSNFYTFNGKNYASAAYSSNGINWNTTSFITPQPWASTSITFGSGVFLAVPTASSGVTNPSKTPYSTGNGVNWERWGFAPSGDLPSSGNWKATYGSGKFLVCKQGSFPNNTCAYSDGLVWFPALPPKDQQIEAVNYAYGKFVIIGGQKISYTGLNKVNNSFTLIDTIISNNWSGYAFGRGLHLLIARNSSSFIYWNTSNTAGSGTTGAIQNKNWNDIKYGGGIFVAVSSDINGISYSNNGITFSPVTISASSRLSITYGSGRFVCVGDSSTAIYSSNGSSWTTVTLPSSSWKNIKYGLGKFVAIKNGTSFIYSSNGINWTTGTLPNGNWDKLNYGNGIFVAMSNSNTNEFIYSKNGINWTTGTLPITTTILSMTYGGGIFLAIPSSTSQGTLSLYSYDGIKWNFGSTFDASNGNNAINCIGYGAGQFVAPISNKNKYYRMRPVIFRQTNVAF